RPVHAPQARDLRLDRHALHVPGDTVADPDPELARELFLDGDAGEAGRGHRALPCAAARGGLARACTDWPRMRTAFIPALLPPLPRHELFRLGESSPVRVPVLPPQR